MEFISNLSRFHHLNFSPRRGQHRTGECVMEDFVQPPPSPGGTGGPGSTRWPQLARHPQPWETVVDFVQPPPPPGGTGGPGSARAASQLNHRFHGKPVRAARTRMVGASLRKSHNSQPSPGGSLGVGFYASNIHRLVAGTNDVPCFRCAIGDMLARRRRVISPVFGRCRRTACVVSAWKISRNQIAL